jgi:hypothetical protein
MKPRLWTAILLFISAYSPLFLILAVKDFDFKCSYTLKHPLAIYIILGLALLSVILLFITTTSIKRGNMPVRVKSVKNRSSDLINYTIPYIVSFFGFDLSKMEDVISLSIFLLLLLFLTVRSKSVFLNPVLLLAGYNLYDLEYTFDKKNDAKIVLSKYELKVGERYYIKNLTRFLYMTTEKIEENDNQK